MMSSNSSTLVIDQRKLRLALIRRLRIAILFGILNQFASATFAEEPSVEAVEFFEKKIRPVLVQHCYPCHSGEAEKVQGGLLLDTRAGVRAGGDSGPALLPGQPSESLLLDALRYQSLQMPPTEKLPDQVLADFEKWIRSGAADPREGALNRTEPAFDLEQGRSYWAFQPPQESPVPEVQNAAWPRTDIDHYILAGLESQGLQPSPDADRQSLLRRVHFALVGLPPTPQELEAFATDPSPLAKATATVVDRLLSSKGFGERWGRHWLDVVRYSDSSGGGRSALFRDAWRYRDYVIDAFNADLPYDQFLQEQIAGDLMEGADWKVRRQQLAATAFLLLGPTNFELQDKAVLDMDIVDEQLDTMGKAFLGLTLGCARCHDHKFDPIPTHDYYAMAGILKSTKSTVHSNVSTWTTTKLPISTTEQLQLKIHQAHVAGLEKERDLLKVAIKQAGEAQAEKSKQEKKQHKLLQDSVAAKLKALEKEIRQLKSKGPKQPLAMAVTEQKQVGDIPIAIRGATHNKGAIVPRGALQVCSTAKFPQIEVSQSGRTELAEWITHADHPLTARVYVNRVWYWLFGNGIVRTVDNFGATGDQPSHPELLDLLAMRFMQKGWSTKSLVREILLSRAYGMSTNTNKRPLQVDPENRLLWKMNRQRLEAECVRDAMLSISGNLEAASGGSAIAPDTKSEIGYVFSSKKRSVYLPVFRNQLPELFEVFDFADPNIQTGWRGSSITAPQANYLMNHPFVIENSFAAGKRLSKKSKLTRNEKIQFAFLQVLGRSPNPAEVEIAGKFLQESQEDARRWGLFYQALFQSLDFRYLN